jgi:1-acyl-sn-glycerol-3-phosphate acyltransferase
VLALLRIITLFVYFILINTLLLLFFLTRPFHHNSVALAGKWYASMAKIMGLTVIVQNREIIDPKQTYVCIANHQNSFDLMTVCKAAFDGVVTVGKKSLKWIPFFGQLYYLSGNIMIDRNNSGRARDTLKLTVKRILDGNFSVWFFPEGTRSNGQGLLPFKTGAFRIAEETDKPILMICASNTHKQIKWNRWDNGTVLIRFYEPELLDESKDIKQWTMYFHNQMKQRLIELNETADTYNHTVQLKSKRDV